MFLGTISFFNLNFRVFALQRVIHPKFLIVMYPILGCIDIFIGIEHVK